MKSYLEETEERKQLESLVHNFKKELILSRQCETSERLRATSCQQYVAHEQEIVRQLIAVRGENVKLMESVAKFKENEIALKQELTSQQLQHEQETMKIQEQHKVELVCLNTKHDVEIKEKQANWDKKETEWNKHRAELMANIEALQKKLDISAETASIAASLFEEKINNLQTENGNLRKELRDMQENISLQRERYNANINMWKKKSLQQERPQKTPRLAAERQLPEPPNPPSILKKAKSVKFGRDAVLSSPNDFQDAGAGGPKECDRVCTPMPFPWDVPQHPGDTSSRSIPKKRRLFSDNSAMDEDLYER
ncbi:trichoplein keratin filament-binding protein-like [Bacillus rossius redtenbacheri]|uniref:trichoplein keratin filament-binding protein-like n=1 Tax=Bacillus rossius redtenbacheri TaxID=93214 RepID=UPI002FDEAF9A